ncbi:MAG: hypothetical protein JJ979_22260 [Roseibium sp.]|nr:hypothetical protein [Roseibium sp.]
MMPYTLPEPVRTNPRHFTYLATTFCLLACALVAVRASYWSSHFRSESLRVEQNVPVTLSVGETRFALPVSYIVSPHQRRASLGSDNRFQSLRLAMAWPDLSASSALATTTDDKKRAVDTIRVELESNPGRESLRARLDPFYRRLARGGEQPGPEGLKLLTLSARGAHKTDLIVYDPSQQNGFIARCLRKSLDQPALCHRAVALNQGLEVRYSFHQSLLSDWQRLDQAVIGKVEEFRAL